MASPTESASFLTQFQPLIQVIVGGLLTFMGGVLGPHIIEKLKHNRDAKNLAFAFRGELIAIRTIVNHRNYLGHLTQIIEHVKATNEPFIFKINVRQNYFNVYEKNVDKLGLLPNPLPELISTFYTQAKSVLEDLQSLRDGDFSSPNTDLVDVYEELYNLLYNTMKLVDTITQEIETAYN